MRGHSHHHSEAEDAKGMSGAGEGTMHAQIHLPPSGFCLSLPLAKSNWNLRSKRAWSNSLCRDKSFGAWRMALRGQEWLYGNK